MQYHASDYFQSVNESGVHRRPSLFCEDFMAAVACLGGYAGFYPACCSGNWPPDLYPGTMVEQKLAG